VQVGDQALALRQLTKQRALHTTGGQVLFEQQGRLRLVARGVGRVGLQESREQLEDLALELCPLFPAGSVDAQAATSRRQTMGATR
jgi:hypothetical protein